MFKSRFLLILFLSACSQRPSVFIPPEPFEIADGTRFIVLGDWGRRGNAKQQAVANAMAFTANLYPIDFVLTTGDNFYRWGVRSTHDKHWKDSFENVYSENSLHVPWYASLGNHDHYGRIDAQIDYTKQSERWNMPAKYYTQSITAEDSTDILLIITDTPSLIKKSNGYQAQYVWLDSTLQNSTADWNIVIGHHPIRTGGKHGENPNLIQKLKPIFDKNNVLVYFTGHDHDLQFLKDKNVHHIISGGGSSTRKVKNTKYTLYKKSTLGFVFCSINRSELHLYFVDEMAHLLYSYTIEK
ncbi:MAG: metallophosphoesterase [Candidatus Marinimicrobia bacterium]|nr:metallophosphoesterase [Candidatus Neomarinimicrobiota bacterium]